MRVNRRALLACVVFIAAAAAQIFPAAAADTKSAEASASATDKAICLGCHGNEGFTMPGADGKVRQLHVPRIPKDNTDHVPAADRLNE